MRSALLLALSVLPLAGLLGGCEPTCKTTCKKLLDCDDVDTPRLSRDEVWRLAYALDGQAHTAAAALFAGLALVSAQAEELVRRSPAVPPLKVVVALHAVQLSTAEAREVLPETVPLKDAIFNLGHVLLLLDRPGEALPFFERAVALEPDNEMLRKNRERTREKVEGR